MNLSIFWRLVWKEYRLAAGAVDRHGRADRAAAVACRSSSRAMPHGQATVLSI